MESTRTHWLAVGLWMIAAAAAFAQQDQANRQVMSAGEAETLPAANAALDLAQFAEPQLVAEQASTTSSATESGLADVALASPSSAIPNEPFAPPAEAADETIVDATPSPSIPRHRSFISNALSNQRHHTDEDGDAPHAASSIPAAPWYRTPYVALAGVLLLIGTLAKMAKRCVPAARPLAAHALQIIGRMPLSAKQSVVLLHIGNRLVLIGVTTDRMQTLAEIRDLQEVSLLLGRVAGAAGRTEDAFQTSLSTELDHFEQTEEEADTPEPATQATLEQTKDQLQSLLGRLRSLQTG